MQTAGACADLFALGLLLVHLIGRGCIDLTSLRSRVDELTRWLRSHGDQAASLPARALVEGIGKMESPEVAGIWQRLLGDLPEHAPLRELVKELLGAALQAFVRGVPGFSYAQHRAQETPDMPSGPTPLEKFRADVLAIRNRLVTLAQTHDLHEGRVARFRRAGLTQCLAWLKKQASANPVGKPPEYDRARISCALDLLSSDPFHNAREFRFLLRYYRGGVRWLRKDLLLFSKELKARLTMAQMHPVVLAMFEVVSPPARSRNGKKSTTLNESLNNPALKARHVILRCKKQLQDQLDELRQALAQLTQGRRCYVTEADVGRLSDRVGVLNAVANELHEHANQLRDWHQALQTSQKQKIIGWERLELGGAGSWHEFGKRVIQDFADKRHAAVQWHRKMKSAADMARGVAEEIRGDFLTAWSSIQSQYRGSFAGLCRRFLAWLRGRPLSVPLRDARKWVADWLIAIEAAEERIAKIGPPPFDALLCQDLVLQPKRKVHE